MFHYRQWLILPICALWLLSGVSNAYAQKEGDDKTCRDNGGIRVNPGVDIATHLNNVISAPPGCTSAC